jgi:protease I
MKISGKKVAILATHGFEQSELEVPRDKLKAAGATVHIVSPENGEIKGWDKKDWGRPVKVDRHLGDVSIDEYDAIVLPGGQINPDLLRVNADALEFIRGFFDQKKVVAAVCHAPWLLIETGIIKGRKATSYHSIKTDCINAGAKWKTQMSSLTRASSPRATPVTLRHSRTRSSRRSRKAATLSAARPRKRGGRSH